MAAASLRLRVAAEKSLQNASESLHLRDGVPWWEKRGGPQAWCLGALSACFLFRSMTVEEKFRSFARMAKDKDVNINTKAVMTVNSAQEVSRAATAEDGLA